MREDIEYNDELLKNNILFKFPWKINVIDKVKQDKLNKKRMKKTLKKMKKLRNKESQSNSSNSSSDSFNNKENTQITNEAQDLIAKLKGAQQLQKKRKCPFSFELLSTNNFKKQIKMEQINFESSDSDEESSSSSSSSSSSNSNSNSNSQNSIKSNQSGPKKRFSFIFEDVEKDENSLNKWSGILTSSSTETEEELEKSIEKDNSFLLEQNLDQNIDFPLEKIQNNTKNNNSSPKTDNKTKTLPKKKKKKNNSILAKNNKPRLSVAAQNNFSLKNLVNNEERKNYTMFQQGISKIVSKIIDPKTINKKNTQKTQKKGKKQNQGNLGSRKSILVPKPQGKKMKKSQVSKNAIQEIQDDQYVKNNLKIALGQNLVNSAIQQIEKQQQNQDNQNKNMVNSQENQNLIMDNSQENKNQKMENSQENQNIENKNNLNFQENKRNAIFNNLVKDDENVSEQQKKLDLDNLRKDIMNKAQQEKEEKKKKDKEKYKQKQQGLLSIFFSNFNNEFIIKGQEQQKREEEYLEKKRLKKEEKKKELERIKEESKKFERNLIKPGDMKKSTKMRASRTSAIGSFGALSMLKSENKLKTQVQLNSVQDNIEENSQKKDQQLQNNITSLDNIPLDENKLQTLQNIDQQDIQNSQQQIDDEYQKAIQQIKNEKNAQNQNQLSIKVIEDNNNNNNINDNNNNVDLKKQSQSSESSNSESLQNLSNSNTKELNIRKSLMLMNQNEDSLGKNSILLQRRTSIDPDTNDIRKNSLNSMRLRSSILKTDGLELINQDIKDENTINNPNTPTNEQIQIQSHSFGGQKNVEEIKLSCQEKYAIDQELVISEKDSDLEVDGSFSDETSKESEEEENLDNKKNISDENDSEGEIQNENKQNQKIGSRNKISFLQKQSIRDSKNLKVQKSSINNGRIPSFLGADINSDIKKSLLPKASMNLQDVSEEENSSSSKEEVDNQKKEKKLSVGTSLVSFIKKHQKSQNKQIIKKLEKEKSIFNQDECNKIIHQKKQTYVKKTLNDIQSETKKILSNNFHSISIQQQQQSSSSQQQKNLSQYSIPKQIYQDDKIQNINLKQNNNNKNNQFLLTNTNQQILPNIQQKQRDLDKITNITNINQSNTFNNNANNTTNDVTQKQENTEDNKEQSSKVKGFFTKRKKSPDQNITNDENKQKDKEQTQLNQDKILSSSVNNSPSPNQPKAKSFFYKTNQNQNKNNQKQTTITNQNQKQDQILDNVDLVIINGGSVIEKESQYENFLQPLKTTTHVKKQKSIRRSLSPSKCISINSVQKYPIQPNQVPNFINNNGNNQNQQQERSPKNKLIRSTSLYSQKQNKKNQISPSNTGQNTSIKQVTTYNNYYQSQEIKQKTNKLQQNYQMNKLSKPKIDYSKDFVTEIDPNQSLDEKEEIQKLEKQELSQTQAIPKQNQNQFVTSQLFELQSQSPKGKKIKSKLGGGYSQQLKKIYENHPNIDNKNENLKTYINYNQKNHKNTSIYNKNNNNQQQIKNQNSKFQKMEEELQEFHDNFTHYRILDTLDNLVKKLPNTVIDYKDQRLGDDIVDAFRFRAELEIKTLQNQSLQQKLHQFLTDFLITQLNQNKSDKEIMKDTYRLKQSFYLGNANLINKITQYLLEQQESNSDIQQSLMYLLLQTDLNSPYIQKLQDVIKNNFQKEITQFKNKNNSNFLQKLVRESIFNNLQKKKLQKNEELVVNDQENTIKPIFSIFNTKLFVDSLYEPDFFQQWDQNLELYDKDDFDQDIFKLNIRQKLNLFEIGYQEKIPQEDDQPPIIQEQFYQEQSVKHFNLQELQKSASAFRFFPKHGKQQNDENQKRYNQLEFVFLYKKLIECVENCFQINKENIMLRALQKEIKEVYHVSRIQTHIFECYLDQGICVSHVENLITRFNISVEEEGDLLWIPYLYGMFLLRYSKNNGVKVLETVIQSSLGLSPYDEYFIQVLNIQRIKREFILKGLTPKQQRDYLYENSFFKFYDKDKDIFFYYNFQKQQVLAELPKITIYRQEKYTILEKVIFIEILDGMAHLVQNKKYKAYPINFEVVSQDQKQENNENYNDSSSQSQF